MRGRITHTARPFIQPDNHFPDTFFFRPPESVRNPGRGAALSPHKLFMTTLLADSRPADAPEDARALEGLAVRPLVLIVEDHEDTRVMLRTMLELRGYRVAEAGDGEEGLRLARRERPRAVIMDVTLPRLDGLAATRRIRADKRLARVPVVFLSGHARPDFRAEALDAGGTDFLVKPFALEDLAAVLERHMRADA